MAKRRKPLTAKYLGLVLHAGEEVSSRHENTRDDFVVVQRGYPFAFIPNSGGWAPLFQTTRYQRRGSDGHRWTGSQKVARRHLTVISTGYEVGERMSVDGSDTTATLGLIAREALWRLWSSRKDR